MERMYIKWKRRKKTVIDNDDKEIEEGVPSNENASHYIQLKQNLSAVK